MSPPEGQTTDPIELAGLFEGDIILSNTNMKNVNITEFPGPERNAIILDRQKWVGGVIPYFISAQFSKFNSG